jgi:hypothetical protein
MFVKLDELFFFSIKKNIQRITIVSVKTIRKIRALVRRMAKRKFICTWISGGNDMTCLKKETKRQPTKAWKKRAYKSCGLKHNL